MFYDARQVPNPGMPIGHPFQQWHEECERLRDVIRREREETTKIVGLARDLLKHLGGCLTGECNPQAGPGCPACLLSDILGEFGE